jgi:hypothetical protein
MAMGDPNHIKAVIQARLDGWRWSAKKKLWYLTVPGHEDIAITTPHVQHAVKMKFMSVTKQPITKS